MLINQLRTSDKSEKEIFVLDKQSNVNGLTCANVLISFSVTRFNFKKKRLFKAFTYKKLKKKNI